MGNKTSKAEQSSINSGLRKNLSSEDLENSPLNQIKISRRVEENSKIEKKSEESIKISEEFNQNEGQSCFQLYRYVLDTAQNYKIEKFLIEEQELKKMTSKLSKKVKFVGLYGDSSIIQSFIEGCFGEPLTIFPSSEGVYLFLNENHKNKGILAYISEESWLFTNKPMKLGNRAISIIRILSDICLRIVACISNEILENWYFFDDGQRNPFVAKILKGVEAKLETRVVTESSIKPLKVDNYIKKHSNIYLPKDNSKFVFSFEFNDFKKIISGKLETESQKLLHNTRDLPENSKDAVLGLIDQFFLDLGFATIDKSKARKDLNSILVNYLKILNKKTTQVFKDIVDEFKVEQFQLKNSFKGFRSRFKFLLFSDKKEDFLQAFQQTSTYFMKKLSLDAIIEKQLNLLQKDPKGPETFVCSTLEVLHETFDDLKTSKKAEILEDLQKVLKIKSNKKIVEKFLKHLSGPFVFKIPESLLEKVANLYKSFKKFLGDEDESFIDKINSKIIDELQTDRVLFSLFRSKIEFGLHEPDGKIESSLKKSKKLFQFYISATNPRIKQIVYFSNDFCYIFIENAEELKTHVIRFNPNTKGKENFELLDDILDSDIVVAWGSNVNKFVIFMNTKKTAFHGSLFENKYIQLNIELKVYGKKIDSVLTSVYIHKTRRLFILTRSGDLYKKELSNDEIGLVLVTISNVQNGEKIKFSSNSGEPFEALDVTPDEEIFVMQTKKFIECYNKDLSFLYNIRLKSSFESFKTLHVDGTYILFVKSKRIKTFQMTTPQRISVISTNKNMKEIIEGNPILDVHQLGIIKFGPIMQETLMIKGQRSLGYYLKDGDNQQVSSYLSHLGKVSNSFKLLFYTSPETVFSHLKPTKKSLFSLTVLTRLPLHLAVIELGNLKPLQNGENNFDKFLKSIKKKSFLESLTKYIKFSCFEEVLSEMNDLLVFSIIGRQSLGKSYLLNRIVGTRFDVAAERCTEGIWMGIGKINQKFVVVFDCEGMFTVERSTQEEVKLCMFLSSLSDLVILNSDLSSGKQIIALFNQFASGVERIKSDQLFGGILDITFRDIPDGQGEGASIEFQKFLTTLVSAQQQETLMKLFSKNIFNSQYHNFENEIFEQEICKSRENYQSIPQKWKNGQTLTDYIKIVLAQIYTDLKTNSNEELLRIKLEKSKKKFEKSLIDSTKARKILGSRSVEVSFEFGKKTCMFEVALSDYENNPEDPFSQFRSFFNNGQTSRFELFLHNEWFSQMQEKIKEFSTKRKDLYIECFKAKLTKLGIEQSLIEQECLKFQNLLEIPSFCLKKCKSCYLMCTLASNHLDICLCGTNHCCKDSCDICNSFKNCSKEAGHIGKHLCETLSHS